MVYVVLLTWIIAGLLGYATVQLLYALSSEFPNARYLNDVVLMIAVSCVYLLVLTATLRFILS